MSTSRPLVASASSRPPPPQLRPDEAEASAGGACASGVRLPPQLAPAVGFQLTLPNALDTSKDRTFEVGQHVSAWFYGEWHVAVVRRVEERVIEVRWESEASISRLPVHYVKPLPTASVAAKSAAQSEDSSTVETRDASSSDSSLEFVSSAASTSPGVSLARDDIGELEIGDEVSACFYGEWHPAILRKIESEVVEVLWKSEPSISRLQVCQIRPMSRAFPSVRTHTSFSFTGSSTTGNPALNKSADGQTPAKLDHSKNKSWDDVAGAWSVKKTFTGHAVDQPAHKTDQNTPAFAEGDSKLQQQFDSAKLKHAHELEKFNDQFVERSKAAPMQMATCLEQKLEQTQPVGSPRLKSMRKMGRGVEDVQEDSLLEVAERITDAQVVERRHPAGAASPVGAASGLFSVPRVWSGVISQFEPFSENGWIDCAEAYEVYRSQVYLHRRTFLKSGAQVGDVVEFRIHANRHGQPQASAPLWVVNKTPLSAAAQCWSPVNTQFQKQANVEEQRQLATGDRSAEGKTCRGEADREEPEQDMLQMLLSFRFLEYDVPEEFSNLVARPDENCWKPEVDENSTAWHSNGTGGYHGTSKNSKIGGAGRPYYHARLDNNKSRSSQWDISNSAEHDVQADSGGLPDAGLEKNESSPVVDMMLAAALQQVGEASLHAKETLQAAEYREQNRAFKNDLQAACGSAQLAAFRQCSGEFRKSTSPEAAAVYAGRVLEVFSAVCSKSGPEAAGQLLGNLVLLLPDRALRQLLHDELVNRHERASASATDCTDPHAAVEKAVDETPSSAAPEARAAPKERAARNPAAMASRFGGALPTRHPPASTSPRESWDPPPKEDVPKMEEQTQRDDQQSVVAELDPIDEDNSGEPDSSAQAVTAREKRKAKQMKKKQSKASSKALQDEDFDKCLEEFSVA